MPWCFQSKKNKVRPSKLQHITIDDQKLDDYIGQRIQQSLEEQANIILEQLNNTLKQVSQQLSDQLTKHADDVKKDTELFARQQIINIENKVNLETLHWRNNYAQMTNKNRQLLDQLKTIDYNQSHVSIHSLQNYIEQSGTIEADKFFSMNHDSSINASVDENSTRNIGQHIHQQICYNLLQTLSGMVSSIQIPILGHTISANIQPNVGIDDPNVLSLSTMELIEVDSKSTDAHSSSSNIIMESNGVINEPTSIDLLQCMLNEEIDSEQTEEYLMGNDDTL